MNGSFHCVPPVVPTPWGVCVTPVLSAQLATLAAVVIHSPGASLGRGRGASRGRGRGGKGGKGKGGKGKAAKPEDLDDALDEYMGRDVAAAKAVCKPFSYVLDSTCSYLILAVELNIWSLRIVLTG